MHSWSTIASLLLGHGAPLGDLSAALATAYGERLAIAAEAGTPGLRPTGDRTFRELDHDVARLAGAYVALRLAGRRVALLVDNRIDALLHVLALTRAGAVAIPVNPRLNPPEVAAVLAVAAADAVLTDGDLATRTFADGGSPALRVIWSGAGARPPGADSLVEHLAHAPPLPSGTAGLRDVHAVAVVLATSGTTGQPKAAELTSHGLLALGGRLVAFLASGRRAHAAGPFRVVSALPLAHVMGLSAALLALTAGALLIHRERFDPEDVLSAIAHHDANIFVGVPTMYADLEPHLEGHDVSGVHLWVSAADFLPADRARRFQRRGSFPLGASHFGSAAFADVYGMVELSGGVALRLYPPSPLGRLSLPPIANMLPGFEARVVDDAGRACGPGRSGRLEVRGPGVLRAYSGGAAGGPDTEGWFATDDVARLWPGGFFTLVGRSRDRLKVGGFSVFPAEVETELRAHPEVRDLVLVGVPDERLGERPVALVVAREGAFDGTAFLAWAAERVAGYRRPRQIVCVPEVPRGKNGKIDRARATTLALEALLTADPP